MSLKNIGGTARLVLVLGLSLLAGCASGARPGAMTVAVSPETIVDASSPVYGAIQVGTVTGGSETSPLWLSEVSTADFKTALQQSLALNALVAARDPRYVLNAELVELDQPWAGFNLEVNAKIHYVLRTVPGERTAFDETITLPYTANFSDALFGVERLRLANEGAVRQNISALINRLVAFKAPPENGQPLAATRPPTATDHSGQYVGVLNIISGNCPTGGERTLMVNGIAAEMLVYPKSNTLLKGEVAPDGGVTMRSVSGVENLSLTGKIENGTFVAHTGGDICTYAMTMPRKA
jgi:hypothetical protein